LLTRIIFQRRYLITTTAQPFNATVE